MSFDGEQGGTDERMRAAAARARRLMDRVSNDGSVLGQIEAGEWSDRLTDAQRIDAADLLDAAAEAVRQTRALLGLVEQSRTDVEGVRRSVETVIGTGLPLNRKERFYTGTVLPMIVASDGFAHIDRLLRLCGLPPARFDGNALEGYQPVQFFTEYNFAESRFTPADKERFPDAPLDADTPDVVVVGPDWLLCIEAKMFHRARLPDLAEQMNRQRVLVDYWTRSLGLDPSRVAHVLLVPEGLTTTGIDAKTVTWEALLDAYSVVGPAYWTAVLAQALHRYDGLASLPGAGGANAHDRATGAELQQQGTGPGWTHMGRSGGLQGPLLAQDLATGRWAAHRYEVRVGALPGNRNWFAIKDFLDLVPPRT